MARNIRKSRIAASGTAPGAEMSAGPPNPGRRQSDFRDRLFYIAVALIFAALGFGIEAVAPVQTYDCQRDASGVVSCTIDRRLYGLIPLPSRSLSHIVSVEVESSSYSDNRIGVSVYWRFRQTYETLVLVCADGSRWRSFASTEPLGRSNPALASGIQDLLAAESQRKFHAWTGEKVPLLVGTVFLAPAMLMVLALLLRILLFRGGKAEQLIADLQMMLDERVKAHGNRASERMPCTRSGCTGFINEQGICNSCGKPAGRK